MTVKRPKKFDGSKYTGRPSKYTPEMVDRICELVATHECGLTRLTEMYDDIPDRVNINLWRRKYPEFRSRYAQAKCEQIEFITEDIIEIADDGRNDYMESMDENDNIGYRFNGEAVARARLRIDTRKWLACKLVPKLYGDLKEEIVNNDIHEDSMKRKQEMDAKYKKEF
jgi:hypothetical protein